jgi:signal transduction histidine kinase
VIIEEKTLRQAMLTYSRNILGLSIVISLLAGALLFICFRAIFVRPMRSITESMVEFGKKPEDVGRIISPSSGVLEVRMAEEELAAMQTELRNSLQQKTRLAALGTAVSKINHDLRNILASAQLISDRITLSDDPKVQSLAPKLVASIDRAVNLTRNTLVYGRAEEPAPQLAEIDLHRLVDDVGENVGLAGRGRIAWSNKVPRGFAVEADGDQLFRILLNLARNAVEAIESRSAGSARDAIDVSARRVGAGGRPVVAIDVADTGPGISDKAKGRLFEAFAGSDRAGGTGLGLAIAKELTEAHKGEIALVRSGPDGTVFRVTLPARQLHGE